MVFDQPIKMQFMRKDVDSASYFSIIATPRQCAKAKCMMLSAEDRDERVLVDEGFVFR